MLEEGSKEEIDQTEESTDTNSRDYEIESKQREDIQEEPVIEGHKANWVETFFTLLKSFIGIGILATPSAFAKVGEL